MGWITDLAMKSTHRRILHEQTLRRQQTKALLIGAGIGTLIGAAAGVLLAPGKGSDVRKQLRAGVRDTASRIRESAWSAQERAKSAIHAAQKEPDGKADTQEKK